MLFPSAVCTLQSESKLELSWYSKKIQRKSLWLCSAESFISAFVWALLLTFAFASVRCPRTHVWSRVGFRTLTTRPPSDLRWGTSSKSPRCPSTGSGRGNWTGRWDISPSHTSSLLMGKKFSWSWTCIDIFSTGVTRGWTKDPAEVRASLAVTERSWQ